LTVLPAEGNTAAMNAHYQRIFRSNMTSKCQVTIPKEIRAALGLKAGDRVAFELTEDGNARILAVTAQDVAEARRSVIADSVAEARSHFRPFGMTNSEFYDLMRGPPADV
jgi:AbrB family looped-hinge helix DNA binding protein